MPKAKLGNWHGHGAKIMADGWEVLAGFNHCTEGETEAKRRPGGLLTVLS